MARPRFSHIVIASLNFLSLLWSIFTILLFAHSAVSPNDDCYAGSPIVGLVYGVIHLVLSVVGMMGAMREKRVLLGVYVLALWLWILWLVGWSAVLYVVANLSTAKATEKHKEYRLEEYPIRVTRYYVQGRKWDGVKECMVRGQVCRRLLLNKDDIGRIYKSSILYGCCQPPLHCGFVNKNDTGWEVPATGLASQDPECKAWKNNLDQVCYDCDSCKAGYIRTRRDYWEMEANADVVFAVVLAIISVIACWGYKQAPKGNNHPPPLPPPTSNNNNNRNINV